MQRKHLFLALGVALLLALAGGYTWIGLNSFQAYRAANAAYAAPCGGIVTWTPPSDLYTGLYPNQPAMLTLRYRSDPARTLSISVQIPQFTQEQSVAVAAGPTYQSLSLKPPLLGSQVLDALVGPRQEQGELDLRVLADAGVICQSSAPITVHSRQLMRWRDPSGDNTPLLAGWVTPQADVIRDLVGRAAGWLAQHPAEYPDTSVLHGYDEGQASAADVREQVDAIFDTLQFSYHLRYTQDNVPFDRDATQLVQLPRDILSSPNPSGMCVETTVILASAVERLGMRPYIVIVPGHAFLGVALDAQPSAGMAYWETSDLGNGVTGSQANIHGDAEYADAREHGQVQTVLDISALREQGIEPME